MFLAPGGRLAYFGPAQMAPAYFGREDFQEVFRDLSLERAARLGGRVPRRTPSTRATWSASPRRPARPAPPPPLGPRAFSLPSPRNWLTQFWMLTSRYTRVITSDRRNALMLALTAAAPGPADDARVARARTRAAGCGRHPHRLARRAGAAGRDTRDDVAGRLERDPRDRARTADLPPRARGWAVRVGLCRVEGRRARPAHDGAGVHPRADRARAAEPAGRRQPAALWGPRADRRRRARRAWRRWRSPWSSRRSRRLPTVR